jgi:hypothetical protein
MCVGTPSLLPAVPYRLRRLPTLYCPPSLPIPMFASTPRPCPSHLLLPSYH